MRNFKRIEDGFAVLSSMGKFSVVPLFEYKDRVFAKVGSSYIYLNYDGSTSTAKLHIIEFCAPDRKIYARRGMSFIYTVPASSMSAEIVQSGLTPVRWK